MATSTPNTRNRTVGLVFSKDRALQLDGTLRSLLQRAQDPHLVDFKVVFLATTDGHSKQYEKLRIDYPEVSFLREVKFRDQVIQILAGYEKVFFLVDDNLFVQDFSFASAEASLDANPKAIGVSFRLGRNTTYCYPHDRAQNLPEFSEQGELLSFRWVGAEYDFGYPLEVSSSLYRVRDILPLLKKSKFANPNSLESFLSEQSQNFVDQFPRLLCFPTTVTFCIPLNRVQESHPNRCATDTHLGADDLGQCFDNGWRIDVNRVKGFVPLGCHQEIQIPLISCYMNNPSPGFSSHLGDNLQSQKNIDKPRGNFSIVIPCYNQGRFLIECLESLVAQSLQPLEVIIVNDGSTDEETNQLCVRLPNYRFPFRHFVLWKENGGLSSARNHGIRYTRGDFIIPLDADDKLLPNAIEAYNKAFEGNPEVDIFYPDIHHFGNFDHPSTNPQFNRWRELQHNCMVCSSAIRKRVFSSGYWYEEEMRRGYEDWEFWIRTCSIGPFVAANLGKRVFAYRKWGYSMLSGVNHEEQVAQMRSFHKKQGIWSPEIERNLRSTDAPSHCYVSSNPECIHLKDDLRVIGKSDLQSFLNSDFISRFLWLGTVNSEAIPYYQLIVNELARKYNAITYIFRSFRGSEINLVVFDRLRAFKSLSKNTPTDSVSDLSVQVETGGEYAPWVRSISVSIKPDLNLQSGLKGVRSLQREELLPNSWVNDRRILNDLIYFFSREPLIPQPFPPEKNKHLLVIALPNLAASSQVDSMRILLADENLRQRFSRVLIMTFLNDRHQGHDVFEPLCDGIYHLGNMISDKDLLLNTALDLLELTEASDFLIVNSAHGYDLIPAIRKTKLPIRITAQLHDAMQNPLSRLLTDGYQQLIARQYTALVDRVACISDWQKSFLEDYLYFPSNKVKTIPFSMDVNDLKSQPEKYPDSFRPNNLANTRESYPKQLIDWLFPINEAIQNNHLESVFGAKRVA